MNDVPDITPASLSDFNREVLSDPLVRDIWHSKYRLVHPDGHSDEHTPDDTRERVIRGVYTFDKDSLALEEALAIHKAGLFIPAGRVNAGAGTGRAVTMINCFVAETVMDSLPGIQQAITRVALTMQQGGGVGIDYSTIRPRGAIVAKTGSVSSGVIPFADQQDAMCATIQSAGARRGAMMLTLRDDHPDLWNPDQYETITDWAGRTSLKTPSFISVKRQPGRLTQFNISVLVSDAFMRAVREDADWDLGFHVPRADGQHVDVYDKPFPYDYYPIANDFTVDATPKFAKGEMRPWYVYRRVKARFIWNEILQSTYKYAEPGILFIDRVNERNNLHYCEDIRCTNPCGEQPLPPFGACDLGSVNLAFMVRDPFTPHARVDFAALRAATRVGVRTLDNVLDTTNFPLQEQQHESDTKRRIGLGVTGFADMCVQLGIRYGSTASVDLVRKIGQIFRETAYTTSVALAKERGAFPAFDAEAFCAGYNVQKLPPGLIEDIRKHGIRNGVLTTIAPNGTISLYFGNVASGHEPVFSFRKTQRKVRQPDGSLKSYESVNYSYRLYEHLFGPTPVESLPDYFVGAEDLTVDEHLAVHAAWQEIIDSSISKTINCPTGMSFEDFAHVYDAAYAQGCKGVTTYRFDPEAGRGSVLSVVEPTPTSGPTSGPTPGPTPDLPSVAPAPRTEILARPSEVEGRTYKIRWVPSNTNYYVTINHIIDSSGRRVPIELFINSKDVAHQEWIAALTRTVSAIFRRGGDLRFLVRELTEVHGTEAGVFMSRRYVPSVVAAIGYTIEAEFTRLGLIETDPPAPPADTVVTISNVSEEATPLQTGEICPECKAPTFVREQGCRKCLTCGHSTCG